MKKKNQIYFILIIILYILKLFNFYITEENK